MATLGEEAGDYIYSPYNPYSYHYRPKGSSWRQRHYVTNYGDPTEYFDNYQRARLKAILSQVNPNLILRVRKANTKDVGVQVNPKIDASVQCSLGPRTLTATTPRRKGVALRRRAAQNQVQGSPVSMPKNVRFRRTMAIYSPIVSPNLNGFFYKDGQDNGKVQSKEPQDKQTRPEKDLEVKENERKQDIPPPEKEMSSAPDGAKTEQSDNTWREEEEQNTEEPLTSAGKNEKRLRFQVYFKQFCRTCKMPYNPYSVEDITCQTCKQTRCTCPIKMRHVDPKRPHRQDLCGRCKGKRLSCDSTFSFKYII
ncbi:zygote arrest protein 1 isoform X5 [Leucoraja erinacea]|uniref:zygote arrest protein 1 isoform X5 n=1 Tax=Leucoraja erinaceus TaxID=7782 RepID=UPI00245610B3|nr:zygote arrest protein 1 isoform X5 [Leucoraja erinacea]